MSCLQLAHSFVNVPPHPATLSYIYQIADPSDVKPAGYDDAPAHIPDPEAQKPEDWDDEEDGEWSPPLIDNPDFKGDWKPKMIDNPEYKGEWVHPMIPNPDFAEDEALHARCDGCTHIGFELWQVCLRHPMESRFCGWMLMCLLLCVCLCLYARMSKG